MTKFVSKSELDAQKSDSRKSYYAGEIYPRIFSNDRGIEFKEDMLMEAGIIWLGGYMINSSFLPRETCPVCCKEEVLIPYKTVGSILSGAHTIKFWCKNCGERFVTNTHTEYFRQIYGYVANHKKEFKPEQKLNNTYIKTV
ncbi:hypothetical protein J6P92_05155 [bacterium]|nr:hypothetical protein [bacterium]